MELKKPKSEEIKEGKEDEQTLYSIVKPIC
jgi:hypothetical protein